MLIIVLAESVKNSELRPDLMRIRWRVKNEDEVNDGDADDSDDSDDNDHDDGDNKKRLVGLNGSSLLELSLCSNHGLMSSTSPST